MSPDEILDRTDACRLLGISRQTLIAWIRKGKLKVWKRVGHGSNAALLFERKQLEELRPKSVTPTIQEGETTHEQVVAS
jgi:excisionase family DNA binding protein